MFKREQLIFAFFLNLCYNYYIIKGKEKDIVEEIDELYGK